MDWCEKQSLHPLHTAVTDLADFLNDFVKHKTVVPSTLDAIKSCILLTLKLCTGIDYNSCELSAITTKYHKDCPASVFTLPKWDLVLVLEKLSQSPFEPILTASLKMLTFKCVFLVSMSCSCRLSELHALSFSELSRSKDWSVVYLQPSSDFLAKNQSSRDPSHTRKFKLEALVKPPNKVHFTPGSFQQKMYDRNKLFCPVRVLRVYLSRTAHMRSNKKALFVSLQPNHAKDITKQSVANWLRRTIKLCYSLTGNDPDTVSRATAHEIRAITSSVKFERNLSLQSILHCCTWKHENTFIKHYLRDVAVLSDNLYQFPPLYMGQSQIK